MTGNKWSAAGPRKILFSQIQLQLWGPTFPAQFERSGEHLTCTHDIAQHLSLAYSSIKPKDVRWEFTQRQKNSFASGRVFLPEMTLIHLQQGWKKYIFLSAFSSNYLLFLSLCHSQTQGSYFKITFLACQHVRKVPNKRLRIFHQAKIQNQLRRKMSITSKPGCPLPPGGWMILVIISLEIAAELIWKRLSTSGSCHLQQTVAGGCQPLTI